MPRIRRGVLLFVLGQSENSLGSVGRLGGGTTYAVECLQCSTSTQSKIMQGCVIIYYFVDDDDKVTMH